MLEPILACFFTSVVYLAMYKALPSENNLRVLFFPLSLFSTLLLSFTGYVESVGGASEKVMEAFFIVNLVSFVFAITIYTYMALLAFIAWLADRRMKKIARAYH